MNAKRDHYNIKTFDKIAAEGLDLLKRENFTHTESFASDAIILRSHKLESEEIDDNVEVIARAGAGVNNIPVANLTTRGVLVLNTPGANANSVKELVLGGLLMASRNLLAATKYLDNCKTLPSHKLNQEIEKNKSKFIGREIAGKTIAVIGLGNVGIKVANSCSLLDMHVLAYDPYLTLKNSWQILPKITLVEKLEDLLNAADYLTIHIPLSATTKNFIDEKKLRLMKRGGVLLNFSRGEVVETQAILKFLREGHLSRYVSDFPAHELACEEGVLTLPHLGASTFESEEKCAIMAVEQVIRFLKNGDIINSVNFPEVILPTNYQYRLLIVNDNISGLILNISKQIAANDYNIESLINQARLDLGYTAIDLDKKPTQTFIERLKAINGVRRVRVIHNPSS